MVKDDEELFRNERLTPAEIARHKIDKQILQLVDSRRSIQDDTERYQMPDDYERADGLLDQAKRTSVLKQRYVEEKKQHVSEVGDARTPCNAACVYDIIFSKK